MKGIVDRFEEEFVVIEIDGQTHDILKAIVDSGVKHGDSVVLVEGRWKVDQVETERRKKKIKGLMDSVWED